MKKTILVILVLLFVGAQFVPVNRTNPSVVREVKWNSEETRNLAQRACFDCHSNETVWPWYAYVAPMSWRVAGHVEHAREHLNFSEWDRPNEDFDEVEQVLEEGAMPLWDYKIVHSEARLTPGETQVLIDGLRATFENDPPVERQGGRPQAEEEHVET